MARRRTKTPEIPPAGNRGSTGSSPAESLGEGRAPLSQYIEGSEVVPCPRCLPGWAVEQIILLVGVTTMDAVARDMAMEAPVVATAMAGDALPPGVAEAIESALPGLVAALERRVATELAALYAVGV